MIKVLQSYVKLLGKMDHRKEAWKTSRPGTEEINFESIAQMDLSINSMAIYTFEMRSSIWMRDLIFSLRPLEAWALSIRAMPVTVDNICLSSEYKDSKMGQTGIDNFFYQLGNGISRDAARDNLPLSVSTTYTFTIDHRVLISFCKNIEMLNHPLFLEYCIPMLVQADISMDEYKASKVHSSLEYYRIDEGELINGIYKTGNMIHGHYRMKFALSSQFLRQHYSKIKTGLWNITPEYYDADLRQTDHIDMVFYTDVNSYHRLMAMRSHWIIDWSLDMWGNIVGDYIKDMTTKEFWDFTIAGGKDDPYWTDNYNRILLIDPGVPCPIMTEWRGSIDERRKEAPDSPVLDMYERLFDEGFIKDNPDNEHRIKYFKLLEERSCH